MKNWKLKIKLKIEFGQFSIQFYLKNCLDFEWSLYTRMSSVQKLIYLFKVELTFAQKQLRVNLRREQN